MVYYLRPARSFEQSRGLLAETWYHPRCQETDVYEPWGQLQRSRDPSAHIWYRWSALSVLESYLRVTINEC